MLFRSEPPKPRPEPPSRGGTDTMMNNDVLYANQSLYSHNGRYQFVMQGDCNLVLYDGRVPLWSSRSDRRGTNCIAAFQGDGNLVVYNEYKQPVFASNTHNRGGVRLIVQDDGNVVIYTYRGALWATGTNRRR